MGKDNHGIIVLDILSDNVLLQYLPMRYLPDRIRSFCIHEIYRKVLSPTMFFEKLSVGLSVIADTTCGIAICCIALYDCAIKLIHHRLPELWMEIVLVSLLPRMDLHSNLAWKFYAKLVIRFYDFAWSYLLSEIYLCLHIASAF